VAGAVLCGLAGCSDGKQAGVAVGDFAARCEREITTAEPQKVRAAAWRIVPETLVGDDEASPLGKVLGAAWHPRLARLYVLDAHRGGVTAFDEHGRPALSFGRTGAGPGEFEELGGRGGARSVYNQLAVLADGRIAVMELGVLHIFDPDGRFVQRLRVTESDAGPHAVLHVAAFGDSSVLYSITGAMDIQIADRDHRTALRLVRASPQGRSVDTSAVGLVRNNLNRLPPFDAFPPADPYAEYYRRVWDALPSGMFAVPSQRAPGVCFFDAQGRLVSAHRVNAVSIEVDRAERQRVINGMRERFGARAPLGGKSWEEQIKAWPRTVPPYGDVVLAPDSVAWLLRPLQGGRTTVDLVHATRGYLGSIAPPEGRLPLTFAGTCAYVIEERIAQASGGTPGSYGLRRWCRTPGSSPSRGPAP
jgi:hypothetical protein